MRRNSAEGVWFVLLGAMLLLAPGAGAAGLDRMSSSAGAGVSGVVRDAQGVAQMGALVQVLTANSVTVATAFTDQQGRYSIRNLLPGKYLVRASATLLVPANRANLQLGSGTRAVVNLTLAALFDTATWLPASRRRADESVDDWAWTLRSSANRPILRVLDDGTIEVVGAEAPGRAVAKLQAGVSVSEGSGEFGQGGTRDELTLRKGFVRGGTVALAASVGNDVEVDAAYERGVSAVAAARTAVSYSSHPDVAGGLEVLELRSGQKTALGENVELEVGGLVEGVRLGVYGVKAEPFVRVTAHPAGNWRLQYRLATSRDTQEFADLTARRRAVPVTVEENGAVVFEDGRHQEISVARKAGRGVVEVAYFHDAMGRTAVLGVGEGRGDAGALFDGGTGTFEGLAGGYTSDGARVTYTAPVRRGFWVAAEYATGDALAAEGGRQATVAQALAGLKARNGQAAALAFKGRIDATGTRVRGSYRWQPAALVNAVDTYGSLSEQAFLSCMLRQRIRLGKGLPQGLEATVDVTNLLAQGYRAFVSPDGRTLYFAQSPRSLQAGLAFSF